MYRPSIARIPALAPRGKVKSFEIPMGARMTTDRKTEYTTRDAILRLLSDEEVASVGTAETAARLEHGEAASLGTVLSRKAVRAGTRDQIVSRLAAPRALRLWARTGRFPPPIQIPGRNQ